MATDNVCGIHVVIYCTQIPQQNVPLLPYICRHCHGNIHTSSAAVFILKHKHTAQQLYTGEKGVYVVVTRHLPFVTIMQEFCAFEILSRLLYPTLAILEKYHVSVSSLDTKAKRHFTNEINDHVVGIITSNRPFYTGIHRAHPDTCADSSFLRKSKFRGDITPTYNKKNFGHPVISYDRKCRGGTSHTETGRRMFFAAEIKESNCFSLLLTDYIIL